MYKIKRTSIAAALLLFSASTAAWCSLASVLSGDALTQSTRMLRQLRAQHSELLQGARGALVVERVMGSQAEAAGIQLGDVLVSYAGIPINNGPSFVDAVGSRAQDSSNVELVIIRNGLKQTIQLKPGRVGLRLMTVRYDLTADETNVVASLQAQNRHAEAVNFMERLGGIDELHFGYVFPLCLSYTYSGRFGKMASCFSRLQSEFRDGKVWSHAHDDKYVEITPTAYTVMARGYAKIGDMDKAVAAARRAVEAAGEDKSGRMTALGTLGETYAAMGKLAEAREIARQIEGIQPDAAADAVTILFRNDTKYSALLTLYLATGDHAKALEALEQVDHPPAPATTQWYIQSGRQAELKDIEEGSRLIQDSIRANLLFELGRTAGLEKSYDTVLAHPRFQAMERYWSTLFNRGRLAEANGKDGEAIQYYAESVRVIERQRASIHEESGKIGFAGSKQMVYGRLVRALIKANRIAEAFEYAERAKARALVDLLAGREGFEKQGEASSQKNMWLTEMIRSRDELAALGTQNATAQQAAQRSQLRSKVDAAAEGLRKASPELASLVTVGGIPESRLRALLQPDETLLEYYYLDNDLYCFVATSASLRAIRLDGNGLADMVHQFRAAVQNPQSKDSAEFAKKLHARLVVPASLPAQGKLIVVPHGVLHYLPFNALRDAKGDLIDRYSIRLLPSASVLAFLTQRKASGKGLLVLGNPDLGNPQYDLPGAQKEAVEIARLRPDTTLLVRADASKDAVKAIGGKYAYLHFASHGKFNPERPLQSGLFLAGRETEGMLTVDELYSLNLNADLVTLSACETALGRIDNGDDVIGLTRGFFYAGASSIISSLWPVDDDATYQMMTKFYSELARAPKGEALRAAQQAVKAKYPHPFYWAAFQLTGNAR